MTELIYLVPALGVVGLIVMAIKSAWVSKQDAGDAKMQELAGYIADGAMAFLKAEWKVLGIFVLHLQLLYLLIQVPFMKSMANQFTLAGLFYCFYNWCSIFCNCRLYWYEGCY
jgi:Na+/H+-translocating membrane pyrophosphatase